MRNDEYSGAAAPQPASAASVGLSATDARCPVCEQLRSNRKDVYSEILDLRGNSESRVFHCSFCGVYYLWPYVPDELLARMYGEAYFTGVPAGGDGHDTLAGPGDYERDLLGARSDKFRATVEALLGHHPGARSILDIGAATGDFLFAARKRGLTVAGIELSEYAVARAREKYGIELHRAAVSDYAGQERYDLIHMNHVFEHFLAPHGVLQRIDALLADGGMIYVEVPFQFNWLEVYKFRLTGARSPFTVSSIHHPIFYRPDTLTRIFHQHGFRCRTLRIFAPERYPTTGVVSRVKRLIWRAAALAGQGLMIEAIFEREARATS